MSRKNAQELTSTGSLERPKFEVALFFSSVIVLSTSIRTLYQFSYLENSGVSDFLIFISAIVICSWFFSSHFFSKQKTSYVIFEILLGLPLFIYYGITHSSWIRIDRDPGFIAVGAKIFEKANQLNYSFFTSPNIIHDDTIKTALGSGFDELIDGRIVIQGFPGTIQVYSFANRILSIGGYPFLVAPALGLISLCLLFKILGNSSTKNIRPILISYGVFLTIPALYIFRSTFSEPIELVCMLMIIRLAQIFNKYDLDFAKKSLVLMYFVSGFSILTRADATLTLLIPVQFFILFVSSSEQELSNFIRKCQLFTAIMVPALITIDYLFSPSYFKANSTVIYVQTLVAIIMSVVLYFPHLTKFFNTCLRSKQIRYVLFIELIALVFLLFRSIGLIEFNSTDLWKIYPKSLSATSWYFSRPFVIFYFISVAYLAYNFAKKELTSLNTLIAPLNAILICTYLYDLGIAPDHPWASRRMVYFLVPVMVLTIYVAASDFMRGRKQKNRIHRQSRNMIINLFLVLAVIGMVLPSKPFVKLKDRYDQPKFAMEICESIKRKKLNENEPVFFSRSLSSWIHTVYATCPGRFYIFTTDVNPSYSKLRSVMKEELASFSKEDYLYLSPMPTSLDSSLHMSYESYVATDGSRPKLRTILNENIDVARVNSPFQGPRFKNGFFQTEIGDDGRFFAWSNGLSSSLYLPSRMSIEIISADCAKGSTIIVNTGNDRQQFVLNAERPGLIYKNDKKIGIDIDIIQQNAQCRLSPQDARLSNFAVFFNVRKEY